MLPARLRTQPLAAQRRGAFLGLAVVTALLGWSSRRFRAYLPAWVGAYAGDALWALMVFWLLSSALPQAKRGRRASAAWLFAVAIEVSQLYHASLLDALRRTTVGALVLGRGFLWSDIVCYTIGIAAGCGLEWWVERKGAVKATRSLPKRSATE
ncbi:DUF2809 domain-containing protein [Hymenobacter sp. CRA2]|uniref:ribosomal maturation YjgA family protein n=1 Tax=Hymenobacter sp. CRA2 TaxID=1955620 RepID=UPI00098F2307|nr:DUF2809 domain-containing protein [Hymenobacter sp. CRA2]OON69305.1 hypothetical protein B0919_08425 [Hymenobacter sp. CRA2]